MVAGVLAPRLIVPKTLTPKGTNHNTNNNGNDYEPTPHDDKDGLHVNVIENVEFPIAHALDEHPGRKMYA